MTCDWEPLRCVSRTDNGTTRLEPEGEMDLASADVVRECVLGCMDAGVAAIALDLRNVTFLDSTGLHMILDTVREARRRGIRLTVEPGPAAVQRVFEITGTGAEVFDGRWRG